MEARGTSLCMTLGPLRKVAGSPRKPCFTFKNTGQCQYGERCHYSHDVIINEDWGWGWGGSGSNGLKPCFEYLKKWLLPKW